MDGKLFQQRTKKKRSESAAASMATEADWSELPKDLLNLISERIDNEIDFIRFRAVCSNWRSFSIPNYHHHHHILPFKFPLFKFNFITNKPNTSSFCYLSKRTIFLIKSPQQQDQTLIHHRPWFIRITQNSSGKTKLSQFSLTNSFAFDFDLPYVLDFNKLSVFNLGCEFIVKEDLRYRSDCIYPEKVFVTNCYGRKPHFISMIRHPPYLMLFCCGDGHCNVFPDLSMYVVDICIFKRRFYAVDKSGRTVIVGPDDLSVRLVAESLVGCGEMKYFVESEGELLLVDVDVDDKNLRIRVFMFYEKERKWVKLKNLGDRVLFLGDGCSFSASALELCVPKGNCVIFMNNIFFFSHMKMEYGMSIFHLDQGHGLSPLSYYPEYFNLFCPPPAWIGKYFIPN